MAATVGGQLAVLVSGVLAARMLGVTDRGYFALVGLAASIAIELGMMGLPLAITYQVAQGTPVAALLGALRKTLVAAGAAMVLIYLFVLFASLLPDIAVAQVLLIGVVAVPLRVAVTVAVAVSQGRGDFRTYNLLRLLAPFAFSIVLVAIYAGAGRASLATVLLVWLVALLVGAAVALIQLFQVRRDSSARESVVVDRTAVLQYGRRGWLSGNPPLDAFRLDQAAVALVLSPFALGLYVSAAAFTNLPRLLVQSVGIVAFPRIASADSPNEARATARRFIVLSTCLAVAVALPIAAIAGELVPFFFGEAFAGAVPLVRILLIAAVFASVRKALTDTVNGLGYPAWGSHSEIVAWVALLIALVPLAASYQVQGVAWAMVISSALSVSYLGVRMAREQV